MKIKKIHHVAYRCEDAKETVLWSRWDLPCNLSKHANYA